ncbi:hypothetical protein GCM10027403_07700 [Arthrobacter tecti]
MLPLPDGWPCRSAEAQLFRGYGAALQALGEVTERIDKIGDLCSGQPGGGFFGDVTPNRRELLGYFPSLLSEIYDDGAAILCGWFPPNDAIGFHPANRRGHRGGLTSRGDGKLGLTARAMTG